MMEATTPAEVTSIRFTLVMGINPLRQNKGPNNMKKISLSISDAGWPFTVNTVLVRILNPKKTPELKNNILKGAGKDCGLR
jgi:hypothetical protein